MHPHSRDYRPVWVFVVLAHAKTLGRDIISRAVRKERERVVRRNKRDLGLGMEFYRGKMVENLVANRVIIDIYTDSLVVLRT